MRIKLTCFLCTCLLAAAACAQKHLYRLTDVPLNNLSAFRNPAPNWQLVNTVSAGFNDTTFTAAKGEGVLLNNYNRQIQFNEAANIFSAFEHGDVYLELDFNIPKGSNSGIYLQSRYEIQLFDSWNVAFPRPIDCGGIYERWDEKRPDGKKGYEGHAPVKNASLAPGLWQHLEILFQAPRFDSAGVQKEHARFLKVVLNGITIHENIIVTGPTRAAAFGDEKPLAPLMIQGDHGAVAFRNIRYAALEDMQVPLTNLQYEYYEGKPKTMEAFTAKQLVRKGRAESIDIRLADAKNNYYLKFTGAMTVPASESYRFIMPLSGTGKLEIDGREVIPPKWSWTGGAALTADVNLSAGRHSFVLHCYQNSGWGEPGLGLFISKRNSKTVALHAGASLPEMVPAPLIRLQPEQQPELLRSFLNYDNRKLTHCISVGDPASVHYSYNLKQGALLQVWKGDFLNMTDMWHDRGEPQTAAPAGASVAVPAFFPVAADKHNLPDLLPQDSLRYNGYVLDNNRYPAFHYSYSSINITDAFKPFENGRGLIRTVQLKNPLPNGVVYRLASGRQITPLGNGLYAINNQSWYVQVADADKPYIVESGAGKELLIDAVKPSATYILFW